MREVVLKVPRGAVEDVLDRLLPIVPGGVREVARGRHVELRMRGPELPGLPDVARAADRWPHRLHERSVPDDWRERRLADYEHDVIGGRLVVRPEWAPAPPGGLIDIVLRESTAFGGGTHPTTRSCLELLLGLGPEGSFADLGCGTGVLAILAARLGWGPVVAVDVEPGSVEATSENAKRNRAEIETRIMDLSAQPCPSVDGLAANVPAALHACVAESLAPPIPRLALLSGFDPADASSVIRAYAASGLRESHRIERHGWAVAVLKRA